MAKPTTTSGTNLLILVGNQATPEVFAEPCGLNTKGFNGQADTGESVVPDCEDPDAPAWKERTTTALSRDVSGSGVLAKESLATWNTWFESGLARNVKIQIAGVGWITWAGSYLLTGFNITGERGTKLQVEVTLTSDGEVTSSVNT